MPKKFQKGIAETGINDAGYKVVIPDFGNLFMHLL